MNVVEYQIHDEAGFLYPFTAEIIPPAGTVIQLEDMSMYQVKGHYMDEQPDNRWRVCILVEVIPNT